MKDSDGSERSIHYLSGGDGLAAIYVTRELGRDSLMYVYTDNLGSITALTDANHNVMERYAYDPWGGRRNPTNWALKDNRTAWLTNRGYTGHEHLDRFGIINMDTPFKRAQWEVENLHITERRGLDEVNGRVYDPLTAMFLSPDPFVQAPDNWLNYNRYGYCYNNPFRYTDPSGEWAVIDDWVVGFFKGLFTGKNPIKTANDQAWNCIKLIGGMFVTDKNKGFWGQAWELISRFTWQAPQTALGYLTAGGGLHFNRESRVDYLHGATVVQTSGKWGAVTLGSYITGGRSLKAEDNNYLFQHEYGHYLQSQHSGPLYLGKYGLNSLSSAIGMSSYKDHNSYPTEQDANARALRYFNKYNKEAKWDHDENKINGYQEYLPFDDSRNQKALKDAGYSLNVFDFLTLPAAFVFPYATNVRNYLGNLLYLNVR